MFNELYDSGEPRRSRPVKSKEELPYLETYPTWQLKVLIYFLPIMWLVDFFS